MQAARLSTATLHASSDELAGSCATAIAEPEALLLPLGCSTTAQVVSTPGRRSTVEWRLRNTTYYVYTWLRALQHRFMACVTVCSYRHSRHMRPSLPRHAADGSLSNAGRYGHADHYGLIHHWCQCAMHEPRSCVKHVAPSRDRPRCAIVTCLVGPLSRPSALCDSHLPRWAILATHRVVRWSPAFTVSGG